MSEHGGTPPTPGPLRPAPLAAPPEGGDRFDQSQFHTIIRRISGDGSDLYSIPGLGPPPPPPPRTASVPPPVPNLHLDASGVSLQPPPAPSSPPPFGLPQQVEFGTDATVGEAMEATQAVDPEEQQRQGQLVALFGCKGGTGNTFAAVNLAAALARRHNVCLVDLDLQMGDVLVSLNMEGRCAISHFIRDIREEGEHFNPRNVLDRHEGTGVYVLSQVHCLEELDLLRPSEIGRVFSFLKSRFHYVVVDGLRTFDDNSMFVLDQADRILMVLTQDVPSVRSASRSMEIFRRIGYDESKVAVVLNSYRNRELITPHYVAMSLRLQPVLTLRRDFKLVLKSINEGTPLHVCAPQSKIAGDIDALAQELGGRAGDRAQQGGVFSKLKFWK